MPASHPYCDVGLERAPTATIVTVTGEVDLFAAPALSGALDRALNADAPVVVDLEDCTFFESSGLNALLVAELGAERAGHRLVVARTPSGAADRLFSLTVPGHFREHASRADAVASLAA